MANSHQNGKRDLRDAISLLQRHGATDIESKRGKHLKLSWRYRGKKGSATLSLTPSDWRTHLNTITRIKRQFRAMTGNANS